MIFLVYSSNMFDIISDPMRWFGDLMVECFNFNVLNMCLKMEV
jgi:hypothetical protein